MYSKKRVLRYTTFICYWVQLVTIFAPCTYDLVDALKMLRAMFHRVSATNINVCH